MSNQACIYNFCFAVVVLILHYVIGLSVPHDKSPDRFSQSSAFCRTQGTFKHSKFPLSDPHHSLPWIWDAAYDQVTGLVELTTLSRKACVFEVSEWQRIFQLHPQYANQLGNGLESNILVSPNKLNSSYFESVERLNNRSIGITQGLACVFFHENQSVARVEVEPVSLSVSASIGAIQIACRAPTHKLWDEVRVEHDTNTPQQHVTQQASSPLLVHATERFPVCSLPRYNPRNKQFNLTVCTAMMGGRREQLVEWIEYHLLQGIQHFYIYNTNTDTTKHDTLSHILSDYIEDNLVTIVPWRYANCVHRMASGRWTHWYEPRTQDRRTDNGNFFFPPRAIAQTAALASCYSRFKHTSKYMSHIDVDEFLFVNPEQSVVKQQYNSQGAVPQRNVKILSYADDVFAKHPNAPAISFPPLLVTDCNTYTTDTTTIPNNIPPLPRLGNWNHATPAPQYEGKLLMRTEAVDTFFVHYLTQLADTVDERWQLKNKYTPHLSHAALLHFKVSAEESGDIWGGTLPLVSHTVNQQVRCRSALKYDLLLTPRISGNVSKHSYSTMKTSHNNKRKASKAVIKQQNLKSVTRNVQLEVQGHRLSEEVFEEVVKRFRQRMKFVL